MNTEPGILQRKSFLAGLAASAVVAPHLAAAGDANLNVGFIPFDPDAVAVYARDRGYFKSAGIDPALSLGYCATEAWLSKNGSTASKFNEAVSKAAAWANAHHAETAPIVASLTKMDPDIAQHMVRSSYGTTVSAAMLQPGIDAMVKRHFLEKSINASELIWRGDSKPA